MSTLIKPNELNDISLFIAQIYHQILGCDYRSQQKESLQQLKQLVDYNAAYWLVFNDNGSINNVISIGIDNNLKRRLNRAFKNKRVSSYFCQQLPATNTSADFEFLHEIAKNTQSPNSSIQSIVEKSRNNEIHLLLMIFPCQQNNLPNKTICQFLFNRIVHALELNNYLSYHSQRLRPNSYKAICFDDLTIIEAEQNFYKLLTSKNPELIIDNQFSQKLTDMLKGTNKLNYQNIVYSITPHGQYQCIEVYYDDPRLKNLTPRQLDVLRLIYLDRGEIATRLNMSIRTVDDHFAMIYDEFGTREKKKILAQTHSFPVF